MTSDLLSQERSKVTFTSLGLDLVPQATQLLQVSCSFVASCNKSHARRICITQEGESIPSNAAVNELLSRRRISRLLLNINQSVNQ
jgi:hypothetical protein